MAELLIVQSPANFTSYTKLHTAKVVGIGMPQSSTTTEYGHRFTGEEVEQTLHLDNDIVEKISAFYSMTRAISPAERPFHNCNSFVWYALGQLATIKERGAYRNGGIDEESSPSLHAGQAYVTDNHSHCVLGVSIPGYSLSILGDNQPMILGKNDDILPFYNASAFHGITPSFT